MNSDDTHDALDVLDALARRRRFLKFGGIAVAVVPVALTSLVSLPATAATNVALRAKLQYRDKPEKDMSCANCMAFQPGKGDKGPGACTLIPDDDEISPNGYCTGWFTM